MDKKESLKYLLLISGIFVFLILVTSLLTDHFQESDISTVNITPPPDGVDDQSISDYFDNNDNELPNTEFQDEGNCIINGHEVQQGVVMFDTICSFEAD